MKFFQITAHFVALLILLLVYISTESYGQSASLGNAYIPSSGNVKTFQDHDFQGGGISGSDVIFTERVTGGIGFFMFSASADWLNASDTTHVDGYVLACDKVEFTFPLGDNNRLGMAGFTSSLPQNVEAAYFDSDPNVAITSSPAGTPYSPLPQGAPFSTDSVENDLLVVSKNEYWDINSDDSITIRLAWTDQSNILSLVNADLSQLRIVAWDGQKWVILPSQVDAVSLYNSPSTLTQGSISTSVQVVGHDYHAYTFAYRNPLIVMETCDELLTIAPNDTTISCDSDASALFTGFPTIDSSCCRIMDTLYTDSIEISCPGTYTIFRTFIITDTCNNMDTTVQQISVRDTFAPNLVCPADITVSCMSSTDPGLTGMPLVTDCALDTVSYTDSYQTISSGEQISRQWMAIDSCGNASTCVQQIIIDCSSCHPLDVHVLLEGPLEFDGGDGVNMTTSLNVLGLLPGQEPDFGSATAVGQPYNVSPWNYSGNEGDRYGDSTANPDAEIAYPSNVTDWILLSVRKDGQGSEDEIWKCASLLLDTGKVLIPSDCPCLSLDTASTYYIVVEHRNHLGVMSNALAVSSGRVSFDFTSQNSFRFGLSPQEVGQKMVASGKYCMHGGNAEQLNSRTAINATDIAGFISQNGSAFIYSSADNTLSGAVNSTDEAIILLNNGLITFISF